MPRRTLARRTLLTLASEPWTLYESEPGTGGGGGNAPTPPAVNEHGYPDNTPTADMTPEHQVAYWKHHARKHEAAAKSAPDAAELERLRAAEAELATRKAAELSETERLQKERDDAAALAAANAAEAAKATAELLKLQVIGEKGLTSAHAAFLTGSTREELEASADALKALVTPGTPPPAPLVGGPRGGDVGGSKTTTSGAERYRQRHGK
ncbi:hypothetical protein ACFUGD_01465 [Streptomyces sp. NPDC057217]|uniref:hypothetical protein n=1 Tax=Streptomyces sp. NPDC057217 TaxID=3346054 RepID=UPI00363ACA16